MVMPSIGWSAVTTAGAFLILNFGGLPGLAQLGSLVGLGITLAALVMLYGFLPPLWKSSRGPEQPVASPPSGPRIRIILPRTAAWVMTAFAVVIGGAVLSWRPPLLDHSPDPLRPRKSAAYETLDELRREMSQEKDPQWLIVSGRNETEVAERLDDVVPKLIEARARGQVEDFTLPATLWPHPAFQAANRQTAARLVAAGEALRQAALTQQFTPDALLGTDAILATWRRASVSTGVFWPTNQLSDWVLSKFAARSDGQPLALGLVYPARPRSARALGSSAANAGAETDWAQPMPKEGVWIASWGLLGAAVLGIVERDLWRVLIPMLVLLFVSLWFAFRRWAEMGLSIATLTLSGLGLLAVMSLAGWSWNLLNLMAIPLLLGAGVDYSIHMQLALRRHGGDLVLARHIIGRALLLCAGTTVAGFGSLAWSRNAGLASLGQVCATGIALTFLISVYLLPAWWQSLASPKASLPQPDNGGPEGPSSLYAAKVWRLGLGAARALPLSISDRLSAVLGGLYWRLNARRRKIVIRNLLPVLNGDPGQAAATSRELFQQFARKIRDLLRYESGLPMEHLISDLKGWEYFDAAQKKGLGVLLVTTHLGNWELGAPLLARRGVDVCVITLHEPDPRLTELRKASRRRWGIETLVIGQNPFAFVEVIRRLENGATIALLMDRPPASSATEVKLFGRRCLASIAAAELARATGCVLLPVYIPWIGSGYRAEVLPQIQYDRALLGSRPARERLTQEIIESFEPIIRQYASQWYHFVPIWPESG
jgi:lauroyl/myristoyl acyltransferase